jgi:hypothetical protein
MCEEVIIKDRPLEVGTRIKYYNHERMQELEATVRSAGLYMLWTYKRARPENTLFVIPILCKSSDNLQC